MTGRRFFTLWERTKQEIPGARIVLRKDSLFLTVIFSVLGWLIKVVTLGKRTVNYSGFATTIGRTIYVPDEWSWLGDTERYGYLRHELVHLRQFRRWPFPWLGHRGVWRVNACLMGFCYLFVLPMFFTMRSRFEKAGYTQTMLVRWELGDFRDLSSCAHHVDWLVRTFSTGMYGWMATKVSARRWAWTTMQQVLCGRIKNDRDNVDV